MSTRRWTLALCAWTLLVWTTRIRNIWSDEALSAGEQWSRTALSLSFTALAMAAAYGVRRRASWLAPLVVAFAVWTIGVWTVRMVGIATADHPAGFVAVHAALAVVSTVLALAAAWERRLWTEKRDYRIFGSRDVVR